MSTGCQNERNPDPWACRVARVRSSTAHPAILTCFPLRLIKTWVLLRRLGNLVTARERSPPCGALSLAMFARQRANAPLCLRPSRSSVSPAPSAPLAASFSFSCRSPCTAPARVNTVRIGISPLRPPVRPSCAAQHSNRAPCAHFNNLATAVLHKRLFNPPPHFFRRTPSLMYSVATSSVISFSFWKFLSAMRTLLSVTRLVSPFHAGFSVCPGPSDGSKGWRGKKGDFSPNPLVQSDR